jgi:hypothetical protein
MAMLVGDVDELIYGLSNHCRPNPVICWFMDSSAFHE